MKIKTYVINLKESVDRRDAVLTETAKYPFMDVELVEAVDCRKLKPEEMKDCFNLKKFIDRYSRPPRGGEIGCTLSHRICHQKLLESEEEFALILEDDVTFVYPEDLEIVLKNVLDRYKKNKPYFITLAMHFLYYPKSYWKVGKYTFYRIYNAYGTCAYLINRQAAKRLLSVSFPFTVADDFPFIRERRVQVEGIYPTLAVGASTKEIIPTEIQQGSIVQYRKTISRYPGICYRKLCREIMFMLGNLSIRYYRLGINE